MLKNVILVGNHDLVIFKFRKELINELAKNFNLYIVCPKGEFSHELLSLGVNVVFISEMKRRKISIFESFKSIIFLFNQILRIKPLHVFTFTIKPNIYVGLIRIFIKFNFFPTVTGIGSSLFKKNITSLVIKKLYKFSLDISNKAVFQNMNNVTFFYKKPNFKDRIVLVNGSGINLDEFYYKKNLSDFSKLKFLFIGRVMKEKGIDEFIEVARFFKHNSLFDFDFSIIGQIEELKYIKIINQLVTEKVINYHGFIKDLTPYYENNCILINPSYHEGMSNTTLEAIAKGLIVLGSNISGIKEIIQNDFSGFLFEPQNAQSIIAVINKISLLNSSQRFDISKNGRKHIKLFDRKLIIREYLNLI
jgi:galacturonosyltransferase